MALTELAEASAGRSDPLAERAGIALEFAETDPDAARFPFRGMCRAEQAHHRRPDTSAGMGAAAVWEALDQAPFGFMSLLPEPARELHEPTAYAAKGPKPLSRQRRRPVT